MVNVAGVLSILDKDFGQYRTQTSIDERFPSGILILTLNPTIITEHRAIILSKTAFTNVSIHVFDYKIQPGFPSS